jgi:predicted HNH restriction endonuclease
MKAHAGGHPLGRRSCDELLRALQRKVPTTERAHATNMCTFTVAPGRKAAFVYHKKTVSELRVYFRSVVDDEFARIGKVAPIKRRTLTSDWAKLTPWYFDLLEPDDAADAAALLLSAPGVTDVPARRKSPRREVSIAEEITGDAFWEGAASRVSVNRYERDRRARDACVRAHGASCSACGMTFSGVYGPLFAQVIVVHHVVPLSQLGEGYRIDPVADLRPLCANCHLIAHQRTPPLSIDELKALIQSVCSGTYTKAKE